MPAVPAIKHEICTLCGACIKDCPRQILGARDGKVVVTDDNCMLCAHCYAVCPEDAVTFPPGLLREAVFRSFACSGSASAPGAGDAGALVNAVRSRRSVRRYADRPVPHEALQDIVEFAATAPSGTNCRAWEFSVVEGKDRVAELAGMIRTFYARLNRMAKNPAARYLSVLFAGKKLIKYSRDRLPRIEHMLAEARRGHDMFLWNAPAAIVVHSRMDGSTPVEDAQYASYNATLLAHALGLGSCYIGYAREAVNRDKSIRRF